MENIFFSKTIADNYNNQFLTIGDFVKICDVIKVGVFEVMIENHPKNREVKYNVYKNMSEYISTVQNVSRKRKLIRQLRKENLMCLLQNTNITLKWLDKV